MAVPNAVEMRLIVGNRADIRDIQQTVRSFLDLGPFQPRVSDVAPFMDLGLDIVQRTAGAGGRNSWPVESGTSRDLFFWDEVSQPADSAAALQRITERIAGNQVPLPGQRRRIHREWRSLFVRHRSLYFMVKNETAYAAGVEGGYRRASDGYVRPRAAGGYLRRFYNVLKKRDAKLIERHLAGRVNKHVTSEARKARAALRAGGL